MPKTKKTILETVAKYTGIAIAAAAGLSVLLTDNNEVASRNLAIVAVAAIIAFLLQHLETNKINIKHYKQINELEIENCKLHEKNKSQKRQFLTACKAIHRIPHWGRDHMLPASKNASDQSKAIIDLCDCLLDTLNECFAGQYKFRVSVKAFSSEKSILTIGRDRKTLNNGLRDSRLTLSAGHSNTAFDYLMDSDNTCFASDNLPSLSDYKNENTNWHEIYNATMVVPIRRNDYAQSREKYEIAGYFAADTIDINGNFVFTSDGIRHDPALREMMLGHADMMFAILDAAKIPNKLNQTDLPYNKYHVDSRIFNVIKKLNKTLLTKS